MRLSAGEQIRIILKRQGITVAQLAEKVGKTRQNVNRRLTDSNFTERELEEYAAALGCTVKIEIEEPPEGGQ